MNIINTFPPNIELIEKTLKHKHGYCYSYGATV